MEVKEIVQRIQSLYSRGVASDDSRLTSRHIYNKMVTVRAKLITQRIKKGQRISPWNYQTLPCVEMIEVPKHECPCLPPIGCSILRSKYELPKPLENMNGSMIKAVTSIEGTLKIDEITINAVNAQKGNKYASKKSNYFILNNYLYLTTYSVIGILRVIGLFEDPIEASKFQGYCDDETTNCVDYPSEEFSIDTDLIDTLVELASQELIGVFSRATEDVYNNSADDTSVRPQAGK